MHTTRRLVLTAGLGLLAPSAWALPAPGPQLAMDAEPGSDPQGWLASEKLDGVRALWDGARLRFRSGRLIAAPAWFLAALPTAPLDGELWAGRGRFDAASAAVRREQPQHSEWRALRYEVFDQPGTAGPFVERAHRLTALLQGAAPFLAAVPQQTLPDAGALQRRLDAVLRAGGEGLMLHRADALWLPGRQPALRKLKAVHDAEALVLAHEPGQGRHAGRLGALRVQLPDGRVLRIGTGFSDAQRDTPPPVGSVVTYSYRGRTASGLPRFASFLRVQDAL
ncbi:MAG: DNA ligase [Rubrivivax sp.]|nr:DNA ligase [Rubrivivax sp.]